MAQAPSDYASVAPAPDRQRSTLKKVLRWLVTSLALVLLVAYSVISYFIAAGVTKAERKALEDRPSDYALAYEDVQFMSRKGDILLKGWYIPGEPDKPVVIFVHGISGTRAGDHTLDLVKRLRNRYGFGTLLFDLRAHGESGGDKISAGVFERKDVEGALDYLKGRGVPAERVGLLGFSMGAAIAILTAADEPAFRAVVADSPFAVASELVAQETARKTPFPEWMVPIFLPGASFLANLVYGIDLGLLVPLTYVADLDYPVLIIYGTTDTRIPNSHSQRIYAAAPPGSLVWRVEGVGHTDAFQEYPDEFVQRVGDYFHLRLGAGQGAPAQAAGMTP